MTAPLTSARARCTPLLRAVVHGADEVLSRARRDTGWTPLLVVSTPRVGSNLLLDYLRCLPGVTLRGEVLHARTIAGIGPGRSRAAVLQHVRRSVQAQPGRVRGVKLPLGQLEQRGLHLRDVDAALPGARWVVLYRQSLPEQYASWRAARQTRAWTARGTEAVSTRLDLPVEEFLAWSDVVRRHYDAVRSLDWRDRWEWVSYEELVAEPDVVVGQRLARLLDVPSAPLHTELRKQAVVPLEARTAGDERLAQAFAQPSARLAYERGGSHGS